MSNQTLLPVKLTRQRAISCLPLENMKIQFPYFNHDDNEPNERDNIWINYTEDMIRKMLDKVREQTVE